MLVIDFILEVAQNITKLQKENGAFPGGNNGPYYDQETPVRNTSHFIILLSNYYKLTNNIKFIDKIYKAAEYLYSKEARPFGYSFHHRNKKGKDKCNGLIGQAWTFEALAEASKILKDEKYLLLAEEIFLQHSFNYNFGLWNRLEIDGEIKGIDGTFNHQLWFAVCALLIGRGNRNSELKNRIERFINCLPTNLKVLETGLIFHPIRRPYKKVNRVSHLIRKIKCKEFTYIIGSIYRKCFKENLNKIDNYNKMIYKSIGYHSFNMYAFALLKKQISEHPFWNSELFNKTINYMLLPEYKNSLKSNKYGYSYNPSGFEVPYALSVLSNLSNEKIIEISKSWINEQIMRCYNKETKMMDRNTFDSITHTARVYELSRLPVKILEKVNINL